MEIIYNIIGTIVFWSIIGSNAAALLYIAYIKTLHKFLTSDWVRYYILRKSRDTDFMRRLYGYYGEHRNIKRMVLKYRLRNIKRINK